jgi:hypothetical protein
MKAINIKNNSHKEISLPLLHVNHVCKDYYKIYINDFDPKNLKQYLPILEPLLQTTKKYIEFLTDQGIILLDCNEKNTIIKIKFIDNPILKKDNLLIDKSILKQDIILSQIPYNHYYNEKIIKYYGKLNFKQIQFIIEGNLIDYTFEPNDFYFLIDNLLDINDPLIAEELDWFLSVLK